MLAVGPSGPKYSLPFAWHELGRGPLFGVHHYFTILWFCFNNCGWFQLGFGNFCLAAASITAVNMVKRVLWPGANIIILKFKSFVEKEK